MAHMIMKKIENIECKDCGSILEGDLIKYAMHNWKYCPQCGSNKLNIKYKGKEENGEKQPKILIDIYNAVIDIRNILVKIHKTEICPHTTVSDKIEYWAATTGEAGEYTVHKCLTCGQLVSIPKKKAKEE